MFKKLISWFTFKPFEEEIIEVRGYFDSPVKKPAKKATQKALSEAFTDEPKKPARKP